MILVNFSYRLGRCHTDLSMILFIKKPTAHCHGPSIDRISVIELKNKIKARAAISEEPTSTILFSELKSFSLDAAASLPKTATLQRTIRRRREALTTTNHQNPDELKKNNLSEKRRHN